jgi:GntR family histidine utilization transcriptional repressor
LSKVPAQPIYVSIKKTIERAIMSGKWPPGYRVPSEHELMAQYKCSRMTVNKALSKVAADGLIVRRRRSGTVVASPAIEEAVLEIHDIAKEVTGSGNAYRYEVLSRNVRRCTATEASRLDIKAGDRVLAVQARHFSAGRPFVLEDRLINLLVVPEAADVDFADVSPGSWLLGRIPWQEAEHQISAVNARANVRKWLETVERAACLMVERRTWYAGKVVTYVGLTYPGDQYSLIGRFSPLKGGNSAPRRSAKMPRQTVDA